MRMDVRTVVSVRMKGTKTTSNDRISMRVFLEFKRELRS
jgi:hypothetical protein